ncbi:MAG TPA: GNAT family N-acetyltransferase [Pirellulales bacterium]
MFSDSVNIVPTASLQQGMHEKPSMNLTFLTPDSEEWGQFLKTVPHDFYHLPGYARMTAPFDGGQPEAALVRSAENYFFLPYIVRPLSYIPWLGNEGSTLFDIVSPYGYPGPLFSGDEAFHRAAIGEWHRLMQQRGCVSGFIRLHPLLNVGSDIPASGGQIVERGRTVSVDLRLSLEEMWGQTRADHRRNISKSRRSGMTAAIEDFDANLDAFLEMYKETMDRTRASPYYYFPASYFRTLKEVMGEQMSLCLVRGGGGELLSGALLTECCGIVQYHLSGTFNSAIQLRPSKLMLDYARTWAKARGNDAFHLGGGFGAKEDSVFEFKAGFSSSRHSFYTWQFIFSTDQYMLLEERRRGLETAAPNTEFFPVYRG